MSVVGTPRLYTRMEGTYYRLSAFVSRKTLGFFLKLAYNMYSPSTLITVHLIWLSYNYGLAVISCQNHVFHFPEIDQFGRAKIKRNSAHSTDCLALACQCIECFVRIIFWARTDNLGNYFIGFQFQCHLPYIVPRFD